MKFCDYIDHINMCKLMGVNIKSKQEMYDMFMNRRYGYNIDPITYRHILFEYSWDKIKRPYYNIYPSIIPMLSSLKLDLPGTFIKPPQGIKHLILRLPENGAHSLKSGDNVVRVIFISFQRCGKSLSPDDYKPGAIFDPLSDNSIPDDMVNLISDGIVVGADMGERLNNCPVHVVRIFPIDNRLIEDTINVLPMHDSYNKGLAIPNDLLLDCIRLCLAVCLLDDNHELISPDVLACDYDKYDTADEARRRGLIDKARRRGKFGFSLGKGIEVIPHIRRPHPALVWTGTGRVIPRIILRSGSIVHKDKIEQIPTGYMSIK